IGIFERWEIVGISFLEVVDVALDALVDIARRPLPPPAPAPPAPPVLWPGRPRAPIVGISLERGAAVRTPEGRIPPLSRIVVGALPFSAIPRPRQRLPDIGFVVAARGE